MDDQASSLGNLSVQLKIGIAYVCFQGNIKLTCPAGCKDLWWILHASRLCRSLRLTAVSLNIAILRFESQQSQEVEQRENGSRDYDTKRESQWKIGSSLEGIRVG